MNIYYHREREGQDSCADFTAETQQDGRCKNESFATFQACENRAQTPEPQSVATACDGEGLVYANRHSTYPSTTPVYLTLVANEQKRLASHQEKHPPRGRHAKNSVKAMQAAHKKTKAWSRLPADDRERRVLDYAFRSESLAFTLNLTPEKQAQLRKSERPAKRLADEIQRACRCKLGRAVPISLALEITPGGRLHAHGIVTLERREGKAFTKALKSAGGEVVGCGSGRQTDLRKLWSAAGWKAYLAKAFHETAEALGTGKIVYQCRATVAGAREEYEASLARQKAHRKTHSSPRSAKKASASLIHLPERETRQWPPMTQSEHEASNEAHRQPVNQY